MVFHVILCFQSRYSIILQQTVTHLLCWTSETTSCKLKYLSELLGSSHKQKQLLHFTNHLRHVFACQNSIPKKLNDGFPPQPICGAFCLPCSLARISDQMMASSQLLAHYCIWWSCNGAPDPLSGTHAYRYRRDRRNHEYRLCKRWDDGDERVLDCTQYPASTRSSLFSYNPNNFVCRNLLCSYSAHDQYIPARLKKELEVIWMPER